MIDTLTSLRFFAIFFIFLSHLSYFVEYERLEPIFNNCFKEGYFGVTFFFLLSGFVLCYNYYNKITDVSLNKIISFTQKRLARIYPIHIITLFISLPLLYKEIIKYPVNNLVKATLNITLLQSFIPIQGVYFSFNAVSWNLSSLMLFYMLFPVILVLIKKITTDGHRKMTIIYIILLITFEFIFVTLFKSSNYSHWLFYISPFFRLIDCSIGMLLAIVYIENKDKKTKSYILNILEIVSLIILTVSLINFKYVNQAYRYGIYYMPFLCLIIYVYAFQQGFISKLLKNRIFVYLGTISFSFYMIHQLVLRYIVHVSFLKVYPVTMAIIGFLISLIAANILYIYFENPLRKKINLK